MQCITIRSILHGKQLNQRKLYEVLIVKVYLDENYPIYLSNKHVYVLANSNYHKNNFNFFFFVTRRSVYAV